MSERAQRTRIRIGTGDDSQAEVEVALFKTSGEMPEARHDTRRVDGEGKIIEPEAADVAPIDSPLGRRARPVTRPRLTKDPARYRHGVDIDGTFVDLTELLEEIDERNKLEAAEVQATVPNRTLPRIRIRGSYYVAPAEPEASAFLAHLWVGLRKTDSAAPLRWSKRTNQSLGVLVPMTAPGTSAPVLVLLELEWAAAMRPAPSQCWLDVGEVSEAGAENVTEAMRALRRGPEVWDELRDERNAQRAEALEAARRGETWKLPPPEEDEAATQLGEAILAAVR